MSICHKTFGGCEHHNMCLHDEEVNPEVLFLLSAKLERTGSFLVSSSLLDRGLEEEDRESKRHELHDES